MNRYHEVDTCTDCKHFDNKYYDYAEICTLLKIKIERLKMGSTPNIPDDCPLPKLEYLK